MMLTTLLSILLAQASPQGSIPNAKQTRIQLKQDDLCCLATDVVNPTYAKEASLAHIEGAVKLVVIIGDDGSIVDLQAISGDPLLLNSAIKAVRQWHFSIGGVVVGGPREVEVPLSFGFTIENPPMPAYLHLADGKVIRADTVREFTDRIEYSVGSHTHRVAPDSVTEVNACARIVVRPVLKQGECRPSRGGPSFDIHAIPLLAADKNQSASR